MKKEKYGYISKSKKKRKPVCKEGIEVRDTHVQIRDCVVMVRMILTRTSEMGNVVIAGNWVMADESDVEIVGEVDSGRMDEVSVGGKELNAA